MNRLPLRIATHLLALGLGIALGVLWSTDEPPVPPSPKPATTEGPGSIILPPARREHSPSRPATALPPVAPRFVRPFDPAGDINPSGVGFDAGGQLKPTLIRGMQITLEEQLAVEDHMKRMKEAIAKAAGSRIHTDATRSKPDEKLTAYRIDPFPEEAAAAWAQFTTECEKTLGGERGRSVSASFPKHLYYGDFGSRDVVVTIQEIMTDINLPHTSVTVTECDAATGAQILFRAGELELVRQYFPWDFEAK